MFNGTIADEQEVLTACLARLHLGERQVVRSLARSGLHLPGDQRKFSYIREHLEGLDEETLTDFLAKNRVQHPIEPELNPGGRLVCVGDEEFGHIFRDGDGWARFRREFPESDGTLRFSRIGFDRDVTQAMLYAGQLFDWNVGSGGLLLFSKLDGEWTEAGRAGGWLEKNTLARALQSFALSCRSTLLYNVIDCPAGLLDRRRVQRTWMTG